MEAIGRLAGGIAHDFNNLLGVVLGAAGMLREELAESDPRRADVDVILSTAEKGAALTRQLLVFSRKHRTGGQQTELVAQTQEMTRILKRILDRAVVLDVSHPPCQIHVDIDPGQYEQILMNLVINARDAMPEGGNLSITLDVNGQQEARVRVRDTGIGMDKETQEQIFEPFFTTKGQDQGTGLGLAMVYSSAASLGGDVLVDSAPGEGTEITVIFPTAAPRHGRKHTGQVQPQQRARLKDDGSAPTIFLVEDQIELRTLGVRTLANQGYDVREFSGITQAREAFSAAKQPPDLLITDVRLLDGVGTDLAEEMHQRGLVSRVLIVTGYASLGRIESLMMRYGWRLLMKPYSNKQLVSLVYELLSSGPD